MNYSVSDINGNPNFTVKGIRLKDKGVTCIYWSNKYSKEINEVITIFKNNSIRNIKGNQICISLNGINDIESQKECIKAFCEQLKEMNLDVKKIVFVFVITNKEEQLLATEMINTLGLNGRIYLQKSNTNKEMQTENNNEMNKNSPKDEEKEKEIENKLDDKEELKGKSNIVDITKYDQNNRKNIVVNKETNTAIDLSKENLSLREMMLAKYRELMNDPIEKEKLLNMPDEEVIKYVNTIVNMSRTNYQVKEGKVNETIGVGINDVGKQNDITVHEKQGEETNIKEFSSSTIDMNGPNSNNINSTNSMPIQTEKEEEQKVRPDTMVFTPQIQKASSNDNVVSLSEHKGKKKVLRQRHEKSAAFVNIPVIIFVISILLLIASGVIWFITK